MHCQEIQPNLLDYSRGLLSGPEAEEVRAHLAGCKACSALAKQDLAFAKRLEAIPAQGPANDVWTLVRTRTKPRRISLRALSGLLTGPPVMRRALAFTAAAGIVAGLLYTGFKPEAPTVPPGMIPGGMNTTKNAAVVVKWSDDPLGKHSDAVVQLIDEM